MRLSELQYDLPPELIAQRPAARRDESRLLVLDRASGRIEHRVFSDVADCLAPGDCLVLNDTRVIPARFFCRRATGGQIEGLFLREDGGLWQVLLRPAARLKVGERLACAGSDVALVLTHKLERGEWRAQPEPAISALELLEQIGVTPLPPYIRRDDAQREDSEPIDRQRYQTVYARHPGAVAAPTAGLHFTPALLEGLAGRGVRQATVTLHVGAGTFLPIETDDLREHRLHAEWFEVTPASAQTISATRAASGRIVAVGTTSARVLESLATRESPAADPGALASASGWTDVFIYPPYQFRNVDRLITNFHLPGSTLLAMVMAFATPALIRAAYQAAIERRYRFYSYGDAMLIM